MNQRITTILTATLLATLAGTANAQADSQRQPASPTQHPTSSSQQNATIVNRMSQAQASLASAITLAEKHSAGTAIRARVSTKTNENQAWQPGARDQGDDRGAKATGDSRDANGTRNNRDARAPGQPNTPETDDKRVTEPGARATDRSQQASGSLYAIVTCVTGNAMANDVIIDLEVNKVVGMRTVTASSESDSWGDQSDANSRPGRLVRASDLMDADIRNAQGNDVGDIDDLAINPESNHVVYGVLSRGGVIGIGESHYAIPTSELEGLRNGRLMVNLTDDDFEGRDGFDNDNWPRKADAELETVWNPEPSYAEDAKKIVKASDIIGSDIESRDGEEMGEITDLVLDPRTGVIEYAIIKSDRGDMPIPMAALKIDGERHVVQLSQAQLRTRPLIDPNREPDWSDAKWNRSLHEGLNLRYGQRIGSNP